MKCPGPFKIALIIFSCSLVTCSRLSNEEVKNIKDLDDNMIDLRMYHENLGDAIVQKDQDEALWLYAGMDSVLNIVADKFDAHRKLARPFRDSYERDLKPPIEQLGIALQESKWEASREAYTMLTRKCNGCHKDRDVDKEVQNWLERKTD
jgi:hypothetical protein